MKLKLQDYESEPVINPSLYLKCLEKCDRLTEEIHQLKTKETINAIASDKSKVEMLLEQYTKEVERANELQREIEILHKLVEDLRQ